MSIIASFRLRSRGFAPLALAILSLFILTLTTIAGPGGPSPVQAQETCPRSTEGDPTLEPGSRTPAARTSYKVTFVTSQELAPTTDGIRMVLDEDIGVPPAIAPPMVQIRYVMDNQNGRGIASAVEMENQDDPRRPTTLTIYPAIRGTGQDGSFQPIPMGATVTVTFDKAAGISNPTEGGAFLWKVGVDSDDLADAQHPCGEVRRAFGEPPSSDTQMEMPEEKKITGLLVDWEIQLTHRVGHRNEEVTVIGRGYKNGTTLTFWRDADFDGVRDTGEDQLCQTEVDGNDIGFCTFTVTKPPFERLFGNCDTTVVTIDEEDRRQAVEKADCNFINGVDGLNHSSILVFDEEVENENSVVHAAQVLELEGLLVAEVGPSRRLTVQMRDFPSGDIMKLELGGVSIDLEELPMASVPESGSLHFTVDLPGAVRRGYQSLLVAVQHVDSGGHAEQHEVQTILWVEPNAIVTAFPDRALPNQRINLEGKGFIVEDGAGEITSISIAGHPLDLDRISRGKDAPLATDGNGNWSGYVDLPINSATATPGLREIQLVDRHGRKGLVEITIPPRELTVSPLWGRPGTMVQVTGKGFPARNDYGSSVSLQIRYESSAGFTVASAEPDASGNFTQEIRIPLRTPAPSSNFLRVEFKDDFGVAVTTSVRHEVPGASVVLNPSSGPPGTTVTMTGQGFRHYAQVQSAVIGTIDVTPGRAVTTDANGEFSLSFLVPGIGSGQQTVTVSVAGVTSSASFDISLSGVPSGAPTPVAEAMENLGDRFVRSFHFDNDAKAWTFYDPIVAEESSQQFMIAGEVYLVQVKETAEAILNGKLRQLTCRQGNCWNQIVW